MAAKIVKLQMSIQKQRIADKYTNTSSNYEQMINIIHETEKTHNISQILQKIGMLIQTSLKNQIPLNLLLICLQNIHFALQNSSQQLICRISDQMHNFISILLYQMSNYYSVLLPVQIQQFIYILNDIDHMYNEYRFTNKIYEMYFCLLNDYTDVAADIIYNFKSILTIQLNIGLEVAKVVNKYIKICFYSSKVIDADDFLYKSMNKYLDHRYQKLQQQQVITQQTTEYYFIHGVAYILLQKKRDYSIDILLNMVTKCWPQEENVQIIQRLLQQFEISDKTITNMFFNFKNIAQSYQEYKQPNYSQQICLFKQLIYTLESIQVLNNEDIIYISQFIQSFSINTVHLLSLIKILLLLQQYIYDLQIDKIGILRKLSQPQDLDLLQIDKQHINELIEALR